jgi:hypothetical protein
MIKIKIMLQLSCPKHCESRVLYGVLLIIFQSILNYK